MNNKLNVLKRYINKIVNSQLYIIYIGIILFIKMCYFYKNTIYYLDSINMELISKTFIFSMFVVTPLFFFKNSGKFIWGNLVNLFFSVLMFADDLYYGYSTSLVSIAQVSNLQYSEQITNAISELFNFSQFLYFVDIIIIYFLKLIKFIKIEQIKERCFKPAILYTIIMLTVYSSTIANYVLDAENYRYNKKMQLEKGTLYTFHYLDVQSNMNLKKTAKYKNKLDMLEAYTELKDNYSDKYDNIDYNLSGVAEEKIEDGISLGTNMLSNKDFACINNGIIVTDDYYYNGIWSYRSDGTEVNLDEIDDEKGKLLKYYEKNMNDELSISNSIVLNNLLK